jgi:regulator of ribonuclease activity B
MRRWRERDARTTERIDDAGEADERVLDHLASLGCDPSSPREASHFLYLPERSDADAVAAELSADGWLTRIEASEDVWLVVATQVRTLTPELVRETRARLESLVSARGGVYDGWEAPTG